MRARWGGLEEQLELLRERLRLLAPSWSALEEALGRLPGAEGLGRGERLDVLRGLERAWHVMRVLRLLSEHFAVELVFGGGAVLNYVYMPQHREPPRLTFDLDASCAQPVGSKRLLLAEAVRFNRRIDALGQTLPVPVGRGSAALLYVVEYDAEKDFFPELLPLRVPVVTRYDGEPFHRFLGIRDYRLIAELRAVFGEALGVEEARIDYVRIDISLAPAGPAELEELADVFGARARAPVTPVEHQLASKIRWKLARDFGEALSYNLHDVLKALADLRLLHHVDARRVLEHLGGRVDLRAAEGNVRALLERGRELWSRNYHYALVRRRYTLEELAARVLGALRGLSGG